MAKLTINFEIPYRLEEKKKWPGRIQINQVGELMLHGSFEAKGGLITTANIDFVRLNGHDIMPAVLAWGKLPELEVFCIGLAYLFEHKITEVV